MRLRSLLLPGNTTGLERRAAQATTQIERVPVPLRQLMNPETCPEELLPYLAWAFSVDRWDSRWSPASKRAAIKASHYIHAHKGTIGALRRVVEPLGYLIDVVEWWEKNPPGAPGTFELSVGILETGITDGMYIELSSLIDDAKPLSRHLIGLAIHLAVSGNPSVSANLYDGDEMDVYPPAQRDIDVGGLIGRGGREHSIDTMDVFS
ncbi:phage tail protein I [Pseudomonas sp. v388]|uniref:phage tail protein I n=1 Tax=Pseudomonas sp. v388 TaxID=2479849 RepID=UPI000F79C0BD|nr:phage tail protein I [Pseudomonas sp. v388]RRV04435.1 phage tail protein I [Pseudomonas sp. v388]